MKKVSRKKIYILGAGITGLTAGIISGYPIYEAENRPGGLCASYYMRPGSSKRLWGNPLDEEAYRFEIGGGHWIFGKDEEARKFLNNITKNKIYYRKSSVFFDKDEKYVPYPIQNNLRYLDKKTIINILKEIEKNTFNKNNTLEEWLLANFGSTLCNIFFYPFHKYYTAKLYTKIAPQDKFKSPIDISAIKKGAISEPKAVGYNVTFVYPDKGLDNLIKKMKNKCKIHYSKQVVKIDTKRKVMWFSDKTSVKYDKLISSIPLNEMIKITGIRLKNRIDPYTSVLVINVGAVKGKKCPQDHWLYLPNNKSGFHRVGFYSNVDTSFLPKQSRLQNNRVSIYVEKSYPGGKKPSKEKITKYIKSVIRELKKWEFIENVEVVDDVWINTAYTWTWPESSWKENALEVLKKEDIFQVGRYGNWKFQGIMESVRSGLDIKNSKTNYSRA